MIVEKFSCLMFTLAALVALLTLGSPVVQVIAIIATLSAALSQYAIQDHRQIAQILSISLAYTTLFLLFFATFLHGSQAINIH